MMHRLATVLLWLAGFGFVFAGLHINEPYLVSLHGFGVGFVLVGSLGVFFVLRARAVRSGATLARLALVGLWGLPAPAIGYADLAYVIGKQRVLHTAPATARLLGPHFMIGYSSFAEVSRLSEQGLIGGIYVTRHNLAGKTAAMLASEIASLQRGRHSAGLPPLRVAADQEGGIVSHLAPPLTELPALASLVELPPELRASRAFAFGREHGEELAALGVNQNFAPVLDLKPLSPQPRFDFNSLIGQRAISADPAIVSDIALAYVNGLESVNVSATLKHFPGLGRVRGDTHHVDADLDTPVAELEASDWRPFREVLAASKASLMIGHVTLTAVDPDRPASHSRLVVDGIIRQRWHYQGVIVTDDLVMGAIYRHDVCTAVVEALNASVDLLLVAYDGSQFYSLFSCAAAALTHHGLDLAVLQDSERRLRQGFPADRVVAGSAP